jgi:hypothetical protein
VHIKISHPAPPKLCKNVLLVTSIIPNQNNGLLTLIRFSMYLLSPWAFQEADVAS